MARSNGLLQSTPRLPTLGEGCEGCAQASAPSCGSSGEAGGAGPLACSGAGPVQIPEVGGFASGVLLGPDSAVNVGLYSVAPPTPPSIRTLRIYDRNRKRNTRSVPGAAASRSKERRIRSRRRMNGHGETREAAEIWDKTKQAGLLKKWEEAEAGVDGSDSE